jgi:RNA polymerase sigma factor (sigma-70 family)
MPEISGRAWCAVLAENRPLLQRVAFRILGNTQWAEDLVQDACVKLIESGCGGDIGQPAAYFCQVVRNLALDAHRRAGIEARVFACEEEGLDVAAGGSAESLASSRQELRMVADALAGLPQRTRRAFELHRLGGLTQREIAGELGVSITLVNFMIRDATAHCAAALDRP